MNNKKLLRDLKELLFMNEIELKYIEKLIRNFKEKKYAKEKKIDHIEEQIIAVREHDKS